MSEVSVCLLFPPTSNNLFPTNRKTGKRYPSPQYKRYRTAVCTAVTIARIKPFTVPVVIKVALTPRDTRPRDADNYLKAIIDSLVESRVLAGDDSRYVKAVTAYWELPSSKPRAEVFIRPAKMEGKLEALNAAERKLLERVTSAGTLLVRPTFISGVMRGLVDKGYVRELPGLMAGIPQGFTAIEAIRGEKTA